jgi:hypothetical protein
MRQLAIVPAGVGIRRRQWAENAEWAHFPLRLRRILA